MNAAGSSGYRRGMVDLHSWQVSREIFVNDDIYAQEQERVFARSWLFVRHEIQIPNAGDFFTSRMGEESVILCRDRASSRSDRKGPIAAQPQLTEFVAGALRQGRSASAGGLSAPGTRCACDHPAFALGSNTPSYRSA